MKIQIIVFLLVSYSCFSQQQNDPFISENKYWVIKNKIYDGDGPCRSLGHYMLYFSGDTLVNDIQYSKLYYSNLSDLAPYKLQSKFLYALLREDLVNRKVFAINILDQNYCSSSENLIFDFNLVKGDTLNECAYKAITYDYSDNDGRGLIESNSNEFVFGKDRNVLNTIGIYSTCGLPFDIDLKLIEGVGWEDHGIFHAIDNYSSLVYFCEGTLDQCDIISSVSDLQSNSVTVSPNPTKSYFNINSELQVKRVLLYSHDSKAKELNSTGGNQFDLSLFTTGLYFIEIQFSDNSRFITKIIKE